MEHVKEQMKEHMKEQMMEHMKAQVMEHVKEQMMEHVMEHVTYINHMTMHWDIDVALMCNLDIKVICLY